MDRKPPADLNPPDQPPPDLTQFLVDLGRGAADVESSLLPYVYDELRGIAGRMLAGQQPGRTLQPTVLVHEAYLKLFDRDRLEPNDRNHFFALAARAMRQIIVDEARAHGRQKRGGDRRRQALYEAVALTDAPDVGILDLDAALGELSSLDPRQAQVVELRFFGGFGLPEIAEVIGVSRATAEREWYAARAWLGHRLRSLDHGHREEPSS